MRSTKLWRLPTRGALGNGLRAVAGIVLVSAGSLVVTTRNRKITLRPERDGTTTVVTDKPVRFPVGTLIEISFGPGLKYDDNALSWATTACHLTAFGQTYPGLSSPHWYDDATFAELVYACGKIPVRDVVA